MSATAIQPPTAIGIAIIDDQHVALHRMVLEANEVFAGGERGAPLVERLADLHQYLQVHFETEESLLARYVPDLLEDHSALHGNILAGLRDAILEYKRSGHRISSRIMDLLHTFIGHHTETADRTDFAAVRDRLRDERASLLLHDER